MKRIIEQLPELKIGEELLSSLEILPDYSENIRSEKSTVRLMRLEDIYSIYIPSTMSAEIYNKLYMSMLHSLSKKESRSKTSLELKKLK